MFNSKRIKQLEDRIEELTAKIDKMSGQMACLESRIVTPKLARKVVKPKKNTELNLYSGCPGEVLAILSSGVPMAFSEVVRAVIASGGYLETTASNALCRLRNAGAVIQNKDGKYLLPAPGQESQQNVAMN